MKKLEKIFVIVLFGILFSIPVVVCSTYIGTSYYDDGVNEYVDFTLGTYYVIIGIASIFLIFIGYFIEVSNNETVDKKN